MACAARHYKAGLTAIVLMVGFAGISMSGCAPKQPVDQGKPSGDQITVTASNNFCELSSTTARTGPSTFVITNNGTRVTEFYLYGAGDRVIGEVSNISPGLQRKLPVQLSEPGTYFTSCKAGMIGDGIRGDFTVTGDAITVAGRDKFSEAADGYKKYLGSQATNLVTVSEQFVGDIKKGDIAGAESLYAIARTYYERIQPIAELLPDDLGASLDLREAELNPDDKWTGFHRLEKDLWTGGIQPDTNGIADQLVIDVKKLDAVVNDPQWTIDPTQIAGGAQRALERLATSAAKGDNDVFSHTDLWDLQAGLDGSRTAVGSLRPIMEDRDPELCKRVDEAFATAQGLLDKHHWNDGFVAYDSVTEPERQELSQALAALSTDVAQIREITARR